MQQRLIGFIKDHGLFDASTRLLLAVSGGIDSVVLCHLLVSAGYRVETAHCNFRLRGADSDRDEAFVRRLADSYGLPCHVACFDTRAYASGHHLSVEDAARQLRYRFFASCVADWRDARVVTAHHRDDAAETFFINLLRGTGIAGLVGIRPLSRLGFTTPPVTVAHPLLAFSREEIVQYAADHALEHVEDATNSSLEYRRNRVRHEVLPLLRRIAPSADMSLQRTMAHLVDAEKIYRDAVEDVRQRIVRPSGEGAVMAVSDLNRLRPLRTWLFELLRPYGFRESQLDDIVAALDRPSGRHFYSPSHCLVRERDILDIRPLQSEDEDLPPGYTVQCFAREAYLRIHGTFCVDSRQALFDADRLRYPLRLRHPCRGDRFQPYGMNGTRLLSDFFSDSKLSAADRQRQWLLCDADDTILWVAGRRADGRYAVTSATRRIACVSLT